MHTCTMYIVHYTMYSVHCTLYNVQWTMYSVQWIQQYVYVFEIMILTQLFLLHFVYENACVRIMLYLVNNIFFINSK